MTANLSADECAPLADLLRHLIADKVEEELRIAAQRRDAEAVDRLLDLMRLLSAQGR